MPEENMVKKRTWNSFFLHMFIGCISYSIAEDLIKHYHIIKPNEELSLKDWAITLTSTFLIIGLLEFLVNKIFKKRKVTGSQNPGQKIVE